MQDVNNLACLSFYMRAAHVFNFCGLKSDLKKVTTAFQNRPLLLWGCGNKPGFQQTRF